MMWLLPLLLAPAIPGLVDESAGEGVDELRTELGAREEDLLRTDARIARASQDLALAKTGEARARAAVSAARETLRNRATALYRMGHAARISIAIGQGGRETTQAMAILARQAKDAADGRRRAEQRLAAATRERTRLETDVASATALREALSERTREIRETLGLPEPLAVVDDPLPLLEPDPVPVPVPVPAPAPLSRPEVGAFVHPVWSTLPLLWVKRGSEAPILRYPTYDGAILRCAYRGRVASIERVRGKGRVVRIDHGGGVSTVLTDFLRVRVRVGDEVERGGLLGRARGPVFFEMYEGDKNVDPRPWLDIPVTRSPVP